MGHRNELTFADLLAAGASTAPSRVRPQTDAEAFAEHSDPERNPFLTFGPCECRVCRRVRGAA